MYGTEYELDLEYAFLEHLFLLCSLIPLLRLLGVRVFYPSSAVNERSTQVRLRAFLWAQ